MKKIYLPLVLVAVMTLSGCGAALYGTQLALGAASIIGPPSSNSSAESDLVLGTQLESYQVGKYEVKMSDGFYGDNPCIIFVAYNNGRSVQRIGFEKKKSDDMKMVNDFNLMDKIGKKQQIKTWFIKYAYFNLDPIEEPKKAEAEKSPKETKVSAP